MRRREQQRQMRGGRLKQKAKLIVDLSALPHNHFHVLFPVDDRLLGLGFVRPPAVRQLLSWPCLTDCVCLQKDHTGNHW